MNDKEWMKKCMSIAREAANHSSCRRRKIGASVFDARGGLVMSAANGTWTSWADTATECGCSDPGEAGCVGSGVCHGLHAEWNILSQAGRFGGNLHVLYSTKAPCSDCVRALLGTSIQRIVFDTPSNETANREAWEAAGREWVQYKEAEE